MLTGSDSPFSSLSAITRRARISALDIATAAELPYERTPGSSGTSAIHRPSNFLLALQREIHFRCTAFNTVATTPDIGAIPPLSCSESMSWIRLTPEDTSSSKELNRQWVISPFTFFHNSRQRIYPIKRLLATRITSPRKNRKILSLSDIARQL